MALDDHDQLQNDNGEIDGGGPRASKGRGEGAGDVIH